MANTAITPFSFVYDSFLSKITDDMYMELTELDTYRMLEELLETAVNKFEFPKHPLDYEIGFDEETKYNGAESDHKEVPLYIYSSGHFLSELTNEEINILSTYMIVEWIGQQLASVDNMRMKFTGSDFKMSSQANHMAKLLQIKKDYEREGFHLQRLYKRRSINKEGRVVSTMDIIMSPLDGGVNSDN